jgi:hypothetical protein
MQTEAGRDPFQLFHDQLPTLAERFEALVDAQVELEGLDPKTK